MKMKRTVGIVIALFFVFSIAIFLFLNQPNDKMGWGPSNQDIKVGDYVTFGTYYSKPITWRVIHIDENGNPLLFSDYILTLRAFDAKGSSYTDSNRAQYGSNAWETSTIRQWLNSDSEQIEWLLNEPSVMNTFKGHNTYNNEPGFLSPQNFEEVEKNAINPEEHRALLASIDSEQMLGGSQVLECQSDIELVEKGFDSAFYKNVTDSVFLISIEELKTYVYDTFGVDWGFRTKPTVEAVTNSTWKHSQLNDTSYWAYWLRTPMPETSFETIDVFDYRYPASYFASWSYGGIRPALYLKNDALQFKYGSGIVEDPYSWKESIE